jgi:hypothetical protein
MNQSLLSLGIILSLGSIGCAGLGLQPNSSLHSEYVAKRGLDELWPVSREVRPQGTETPLYADQELGSLWEARKERPAGVADPGYEAERGADLWNPASFARSPEPAATPSRRADRFAQSADSLRF